LKPLGNERGMVLLLVLTVVTLLAALLTEFAFSSLVDLRLAETFRDSSRAYYLANGGVRVGRVLLQEDRNNFDGPGELWSMGVPGYPVGDGTVSIRIDDLGGRIDLNRLVNNVGDADDEAKNRCQRLFAEIGLEDPEGLVDALIDWLDPDDDERQFGAESRHYLDLPRPYQAKNGRLDSFDELLLVRGIDADMLSRLTPHVSVLGAQLVNLDQKLNVNTASVEVLMAWSDGMTKQAAEAIRNHRESEPFRTGEQVKDLIGLDLYTALNRNQDISFTSDFFHIVSRADLGDGSRTVQAIVKKGGDQILYQRVD
jgi:general secretion pathway protein K